MNALPAPTSHPHHEARDASDTVALVLTKLLRWTADTFFARRYGHRAVVLETVAAVPGIVGATLQHLRSLRRGGEEADWIRTLMDEAENERMHLRTFVQLAQPTLVERALILLAQGVFFNAFFVLYLASPRTAHRLVGYFEEEAVLSYTRFLHEVDAGRIANVPAPAVARDYWAMSPDATLRDVIIAVREDEMHHRDANHDMADALVRG